MLLDESGQLTAEHIGDIIQHQTQEDMFLIHNKKDATIQEGNDTDYVCRDNVRTREKSAP